MEKTEDILDRLSEANAKEAKWKKKQEKAMKRLEKVTGKLYESSSISLKSAEVNAGAAIFEGRPDFVELQQDVEVEQTLFTDDEANNDNHILLEDDIIIPVDHQPRNEEEEIATILNAVKDPARLWPKGKVLKIFTNFRPLTIKCNFFESIKIFCSTLQLNSLLKVNRIVDIVVVVGSSVKTDSKTSSKLSTRS